jgi:hypothetical protein
MVILNQVKRNSGLSPSSAQTARIKPFETLQTFLSLQKPLGYTIIWSGCGFYWSFFFPYPFYFFPFMLLKLRFHFTSNSLFDFCCVIRQLCYSHLLPEASIEMFWESKRSFHHKTQNLFWPEAITMFSYVNFVTVCTPVQFKQDWKSFQSLPASLILHFLLN